MTEQKGAAGDGDKGGAGDGGKEVSGLFDKEGKVVEGALAPSEAQELRTTLENLKTELQKSQEKGFNFDKYREATVEEKAKMTEGWDDEKKILLGQIGNMSGRIEQAQGAFIEGHKKAILDRLAGQDAELKKKIEDTAKTVIAGDATTPEEWERKFQNAFVYLKGGQPGLRAIHSFVPGGGSGGGGIGGNKGALDTEEGLGLFRALFNRDPIGERDGKPITPSDTYKL